MKNRELKIFDSHIHVGKYGIQKIHDKKIEPLHNYELHSFKKLISFLKISNIKRAVIVPIYLPKTEETFKINKTTIDFSEISEGKLIPGLWVDPSPSVRKMLEATLELASKHNIKVFKTSPDVWERHYTPDPATWDSTFEKGIEIIFNNIKHCSGILQIHTGSKKSDIKIIEKLMYYLPSEITFHLVHMGRKVGGHFYLIPKLKKWIDHGIKVYCDTSGACGFAVRWIFQKASKNKRIADRILFASDEPWEIFESELHKVLQAGKEVK